MIRIEEKRLRERQKAQDLLEARSALQRLEDRLNSFRSLHKACVTRDWIAIEGSDPPAEPVKRNVHEAAALSRLDQFRPTLLDRLLGRIGTKRRELAEKIVNAKIADEMEYNNEVKQYEEVFEQWKMKVVLSKRMRSGDLGAYEETLQRYGPFSGIPELGPGISFKISDPRVIEATLRAHGQEVIPSQEGRLLKRGGISLKNMSRTKFLALYKEYICSATLRVARELFGLLPIEIAIINAAAIRVNSHTGYLEEQALISAAIPRKALEDLDFESLSLSDTMENFVHHMKYTKTKGLSVVGVLKPSDLKIPEDRRDPRERYSAG